MDIKDVLESQGSTKKVTTSAASPVVGAVERNSTEDLSCLGVTGQPSPPHLDGTQ